MKIIISLLLALTLAGCGTGQIQTETEPAVTEYRGTEKKITETQAKEMELAETEETEVTETEKTETKEEPVDDQALSFGDSFEFHGFTLELGEDYYFDTISNQFSDHNGKDVIAIPVTLTNNTGETSSFNMFFFTAFDTTGIKADNVSAYFDDSVDLSGKMRDGASQDAAFYILYSGDGDYYIEFDDFSEHVEVKLPVNQ